MSLEIVLMCSIGNLIMTITLSHHIHAVDPMVQDLTMTSPNTMGHLINKGLPINNHFADVAVVASGAVNIHRHLWISEHPMTDVVPKGDVVIGEEVDLATIIQIQVEQLGDIVLMIDTINHHLLNTVVHPDILRPMIAIIVQ